MKFIKDINHLLLKSFRRQSTIKEKRELQDWIQDSPENKFQFDELKKFWRHRTSDIKLINHDTQKSAIWEEFQRTKNSRLGKNHRQRMVSIRTIWKVAAGLLILIVGSWAASKYLTGDLLFDSYRLSASTLVVKENPSGQKSQIELPDGSKVWLNAKSRVSYLSNFSEDTRRVSIDGEAYFDIKRDSLRPFVVELENMELKVLGTEFNVSAYEDEPEVTVALLEGSLQISVNNLPNEEYLLSPGFGLTFSRQHATSNTFSFVDDSLQQQEYAAWRNGTLVFNGENFEHFVRKIERWYGLEAEISGTPPQDWYLRASFQNEYLNNILDAISFNKEFRYQLNNKELKLMFN